MDDRKSDLRVKLYKRRWPIVIIFMLFAAVSAFQWSQYVVVEDVLTDYYNVKPSLVEWTAMSYAFCLSVFIIPWTCLLEKVGLRKIMLLAAALNASGGVLKMFSSSRDSFMVAFSGQWLAGLGQLGFLPSRVSAVWFGPDEVSRACAMGVMGNQIGIAIGFVLPPLIIKMNDDKDVTRSQIELVNYLVAGTSLVLLVLMYFAFEDQPKLPPSRAAAEQRREKADFIGALKRLATNKGYLLLMLIYGLTIGTYQAIAALLNRIVLAYFPDAAVDVGWMGLVATLLGGWGSVVAGYILDKVGRYKEVNIGTCVCLSGGMLALGLILNQGQLIYVYVAALGIGFFSAAFYTVGFEFCAELAYPENEGTSTGILNGVPQCVSILITLMGSWIIDVRGAIWCCYAIAFVQVFASLLAAFTPKSYKRRAMKNRKPSEKLNKGIDNLGVVV